MKFFSLSVMSVFCLFACNSPDSKTKGTETITRTYKALDGSRASVAFTESKMKSSIAISANNQKFELDKVSEKAGVVKYERNGISAVVKGDSVIIQQGETEIPLVRQ